MNYRFFSQHLLQAVAVLVLTASALSGCKKDIENTSPVLAASPSLADAIQSNADLSTLGAAIQKTGLGPMLSANPSFTVFAPNNAAFARLANKKFTSIDSINAINPNTTAGATNITALRNLVLYHIVSGDRKLADLTTGSTLASQRSPLAPRTAENPIYVTRSGNDVFLNAGAAKILTPNAASAANGTVHIIDNVLNTPTQTANALVVALATAANGPQFVLLGQALARDTVAAALGTSTGAGSLANGNSNLTVFAPTDAAFQALLTSLRRTSLAQVPARILLPILRRHIVSGSRLLAADFTAGQTLTTLNGTVTIGTAAGGRLTVLSSGNGSNVANIITPNVLTSNAVVHVIDRVLLP